MHYSQDHRLWPDILPHPALELYLDYIEGYETLVVDEQARQRQIKYQGKTGDAYNAYALIQAESEAKAKAKSKTKSKRKAKAKAEPETLPITDRIEESTTDHEITMTALDMNSLYYQWAEPKARAMKKAKGDGILTLK